MMKGERVVMLAWITLLAACSPKTPEANAPELPRIKVRAQKVEAKPHVGFEEVTGTVRAKLMAVIEAKVVGRIEKMSAVPGQLVKTDDSLAELDSREIEAKLDQARAVLEQSNKELARAQALIANRVTTQAEFDAVQARNKVAKAAVNEAETMLGYTTIRAPFDGVITRKLADVGDLASPGKPLLEIQETKNLRFETDVPEALIGNVEPGANLTVRTGTLSVPAKVSEIAPAADPNSRTFLVKLDLAPIPGVRTGQFGRVGIPVSETSVLRVPVSAVQLRGQMETLFVVSQGKAHLRLVKTGKRFGNEVEVISGIEIGEQVVTEGANLLTDGQPVEVDGK